MSFSVDADRSVRPAQRGDEGAIARLQLAAWRTLMGEGVLVAQGITERSLAQRWNETLSAPRPARTALLVALHGHAVVGFAFAGPDEASSDSRGAPGGGWGEATQVYELVVDRDFRRAGHASRMLSAIADLTRGQLRVWISAGDAQRQRFYTSAGFAPSGAVRSIGKGITQHMWWARCG